MAFAVSSNTIDTTEGGHDGVEAMRGDASRITRQGLSHSESDSESCGLAYSAIMSSNPPQAARPRPPARKKPNDDAAYTGPSAAALAAAGGGAQATKRQATDRAEGEPRNKRKKVETIVSNQNRPLIDPMSEPRTSLVSHRQTFT